MSVSVASSDAIALIEPLPNGAGGPGKNEPNRPR